MNIKVGPEIKFAPIQGGGTQAKIDHGPAKARLVKYPAGCEIPRHKHSKDALHIVIHGEIVSKDGTFTLRGPCDYVGGEAEDGPWSVTQDLEMVVIEPRL